MKTFKTSLGKSISAETTEDAQRIATDYGMGDIISEVELVRTVFGVRNGNYTAWDRKAKSAVVMGTLAEAVEAYQLNTELTVMYHGLSKPSNLNNHERAVMNKMLAAS